MSTNNLTTDTSDREIVLSRVVNAPRELVWEVWTDPKHLEKWWGPNGFSTTTKEFSFGIGGCWRHVMHGPDGTDYPNMLHYEELVKPERIVYSHSDGGDGANDAQFMATITFEEVDGKTLVTMRSVFNSPAELQHVIKTYGAIEGGKQHLANLDDYVSHLNQKQ